MITLTTSKRDYNKLYKLAELGDCLSIEENFWELLSSPTSEFRRSLYEDAIRLWFDEHGNEFDDIDWVCEIAERNCIYE